MINYVSHHHKKSALKKKKLTTGWNGEKLFRLFKKFYWVLAMLINDPDDVLSCRFLADSIFSNRSKKEDAVADCVTM